MTVQTDSTWWPVDIAALLNGELVRSEPVLLLRDDNVPLLYPGKVHNLAAETEALKTWLALYTAHQNIATGRHFLMIDFEDSATTAVERLLALGAEPDAIAHRFHYIAPQEPLDDIGRLAIEHVLELDVAVVCIDGLTEAFGMLGLDINSNADIATFFAALPRPIASAGPAVLMLDHVVKARDSRGRFAIGGQHKLAGIDVGLTLESVTPFGRDRRGLSKLFVTKDRPGWLRSQCVGGRFAGEFHLNSTGGQVDAELRAPEIHDADDPWRPTFLMQRVSEYVALNPGVTKHNIEQNVTGKAEFVRTAVTALVADGYLEQTDGPRNSIAHHVIQPYRADQQ